MTRIDPDIFKTPGGTFRTGTRIGPAAHETAAPRPRERTAPKRPRTVRLCRRDRVVRDFLTLACTASLAIAGYMAKKVMDLSERVSKLEGEQANSTDAQDHHARGR